MYMVISIKPWEVITHKYLFPGIHFNRNLVKKST